MRKTPEGGCCQLRIDNFGQVQSAPSRYEVTFSSGDQEIVLCEGKVPAIEAYGSFRYNAACKGTDALQLVVPGKTTSPAGLRIALYRKGRILTEYIVSAR